MTPDAFWRRVDKTATCWIWTGAKNPRTGYGSLTIQYRSTYAHRRAWELAVGPIPAGMWVLHHCDNPPCVRPEHLFLGTAADNVRDSQRKGRRPIALPEPPKRYRYQRITDEELAEMRELRAQGWGWKEIADRFGRTIGGVHMACNRPRVRHFVRKVA